MIKLTTWLAAVASFTTVGCAMDSDVTDDPQAQGDPVPNARTASRHCVMVAESGAVSCFATFPEAIALATAGRITDAPLDAHAAVTDPAFWDRLDPPTPITGDHTTNLQNAGQGNGDILGVQFSDAGYHGSTFTIRGTLGCSGDAPTPLPSVSVMPADWNDEISSFKVGKNCGEILYADGNFTGRTLTSTKDVPYVGDPMNDQGSTIRFFKAL